MEKSMEKIKDDLCKILDQYADRGINNREDVEIVKNTLSGIQKIQTICGMERLTGFAGRGSYDGGGGSYDGGSYDGGSYRRGGYSRGGSYRDGYSGHGLKEKMQRLAESASPEEREMLNRFMQQM